jgi:predicted anti-sigma-YlaC factor YlaD
MNGLTCEQVVELLPDVGRDSVAAQLRDAVDAHLAGCVECRETANLLAVLAADAPHVPAGLEARVVRAARTVRPARRRWAPANLAIAASVVLAVVSTALLRNGGAPESDGVPGNGAPAVTISGEPAIDPTAKQPLIGGMPSFNELSVAELEALLSELES